MSFLYAKTKQFAHFPGKTFCDTSTLGVDILVIKIIKFVLFQDRPEQAKDN